MFKHDRIQTVTATSPVAAVHELFPVEWSTSANCRTRTYSKGQLILIEGAAPTGLHVIALGEVKLYSCLSDGKPIAVEILGPGRFLGLGALVLDTANESTAEALGLVRTNYLAPREAKAMLLKSSSARWLALQELARNHRSALAAACSFAKTAPTLTRLARLILSWTAANGTSSDAVDLENRYTHQQIADMLGTTRETVSRGLSELRARKIVTMRYERLSIHDLSRLRALAGRAV